MPGSGLGPPPRDSLELASLASSNHDRANNDNDNDNASSSSGLPSSRKLSFDEDPLPNGHDTYAGGNSRRSYSVSSAFDFNSALFPLSASNGAGYTALGAPTGGANGSGGRGGGGPLLGPGGGGGLEKHKSLTFLNGLSLVIGLVIGSGIFSSPASVNSRVGSPGAALIVWVIAGLLAWTGAASHAELGGAIPLNGGAQVYLGKIFGEWLGFLFTWCTVTVTKPGSAAIIAIIFGEYVVRAFIGADAVDASPWVNKGVALLGLATVTAMNCVSTRLGMRSADAFMVFKFAALAAITIMGIVVAATGWRWHDSSDGTSGSFVQGPTAASAFSSNWFAGTSNSSSEWAVALYAGLWAYDGWDNTNYVVGEMKHPGRDLPRTIHTSIPLVIAAYLLANLSYFFVLPASVIDASNTVAVAFGDAVLGPWGSLVLALTVGGSCFGALNATTFTAGRLVYSAGKEGYIPQIFGSIGISAGSSQQMRLPRRSISSVNSSTVGGGLISRLKRIFSYLVADEQGFFYTPIYAMALNAALTAVYIIIGDFSTLTTFYGIASYLFYFLAVMGLIVLRVREPELERPYKCWLVTPIIFCCVSLFLVSRAIFARPLQALVVFAFIAAGVPLYWLRIGRKRGSKGRGSGNGEKWWKFWKRWGRA